MPKQSKITKSRTKSSPGVAAPIKEAPEKFYCTRCPRNFTKQKGNFPASQSPIYRENGGYLPVCRHCVDEMYQHYKFVLGDEKSAIRRICMKFDIYWNDKIYGMLNKSSTTNSRVLSYISKSNLYQFVGKTFDDTLDEENELVQRSSDIAVNEIIADNNEEITISSEIVEFWGAGFAPSFYIDLERRLKYWCGDTDRWSMDVSECAIIRQICMLEVTITRDAAAGKSTDKSVNVLNTLLGSANLKPVQKKSEADAEFEKMPLGVGIQKWEYSRPLPETPKEKKDVRGTIKNITTWYLGHACKMVGLRNSYTKMYEDAMDELRVKHPEYDEEDDDTVLNDIFGSPKTGGDS